MTTEQNPFEGFGLTLECRTCGIDRRAYLVGPPGDIPADDDVDDLDVVPAVTLIGEEFRRTHHGHDVTVAADRVEIDATVEIVDPDERRILGR